jgi:hypothetical protein
MAIRYLDKEFGVNISTAIANDATGRAKVQNLPGAAGIASDFVDFDIKYNRNGTIVALADLSSAQTLTNKTLTNPTINGATTPTLVDTNGTTREILNPTAKTIVDGSATALFSVPVAASSQIGGAGFFLIRATDGTDFQADAGMFTYSAEAKATVVVGAITYVAANEAKSVSAGTLTLAFTADVSVANVVTYKLQPTGSLTETAPYTIEYTLFPIRGVVTIL